MQVNSGLKYTKCNFIPCIQNELYDLATNIQFFIPLHNTVMNLQCIPHHSLLGTGVAIVGNLMANLYHKIIFMQCQIPMTIVGDQDSR